MRTCHYSLAVVISVLLMGITTLSGCKKQDEPEAPAPSAEELLIGLWGVSTTPPPDSGNTYTEYFRFGKDNVLEHYLVDNKDIYYNIGTYKYSDKSVDTGTYTKSGNDQVTFIFNQSRHYYVLDDKLLFIEYSTDRVGNMGFIILNQTENRIQFKNQSRAGFMHAVVSLPDTWNHKFSAPEVKPTEQNLLGQWDLVNIYIKEQNMIHYWYFNNPETCGITFLPENKITNSYFWIDYIWAQAVATDMIESDKSIYVLYDDCSWEFGSNVIPLTCKRFSVGHYDDNGNFIAESVIAPSTPFARNFSIKHMTDYYLILVAYDYLHKGTGNYVFHKNSDVQLSAPAKQGIKHTPFTGQPLVREMTTLEKWKQ